MTGQQALILDLSVKALELQSQTYDTLTSRLHAVSATSIAVFGVGMSIGAMQLRREDSWLALTASLAVIPTLCWIWHQKAILHELRLQSIPLYFNPNILQQDYAKLAEDSFAAKLSEFIQKGFDHNEDILCTRAAATAAAQTWLAAVTFAVLAWVGLATGFGIAG